MIKRSEPIFAVRDVKETIAFYRDTLGFGNEWMWGDPVSFGGISYGDVSVMFRQQPHIVDHIAGHEHFYWSDDIDASYAQHTERGAAVVSPIENKPWRVREYTVRDPNGYHLRFGGPPTHEKPAGALSEMPDHIRIEERPPTWSEFRVLHEAVKWGPLPETSSGVLERSALGVVAIDTRSGRVIGTARAVRDAQSWFSIWDVMVDPPYQHQRVGTTMVKRLLDGLRRDAPKGSNVHLFTFSDSFYARLGFRSEKCSLIRL
jgi:uncharacterized glyoxalase superfamily protein PhnB/GNAT superfamily N-acetyltransferase